MRSAILAAALLCLISAPVAYMQTGQAPGAPAPGAQVPGMPPRDNSGTTPQTGTGRIRGRVVAADTGQPLRRAQVILFAEGGPAGLMRSTTTDADGRFDFQDLPAGRFTMQASKTGYVDLQYGQRRPFEPGTPVPLADAQTLERVDFALPRGGVIVVRVTDDFGDPLAGAQVQVQRYQYQPDGQRRLVSAPSGAMLGAMAMTNDRGEFRVFGMMPGEYVVSATYRNFRLAGVPNHNGEGFAATYYPGVLSADQAAPISVRIGQETPVEFSMMASRLSRITGTVVDSGGRPAAGAQLSVTTRADSVASIASAVVGPDGSFTLSGVAPGDYFLDVRPAGIEGPATFFTGESASVPISIAGADVSGVEIVTDPGTTIRGRVVFDGNAPRGAASAPGGDPIFQLRVTTMQADPARRRLVIISRDPLANGNVDEEGRFQLAGARGRVLFNVVTPPGWAVKSITLDGRDVYDEPLDLTGRTAISDVVVTLTDKLTTINGQVVDGRGQRLRDYAVVILPVQEMDAGVAARWIRTVRPNADGRFETRGMRPGRYIAAAVEALEQGRQFAPDFQRQLRSGAREFTVDEGQIVTLDLRLTGL